MVRLRASGAFVTAPVAMVRMMARYVQNYSVMKNGINSLSDEKRALAGSDPLIIGGLSADEKDGSLFFLRVIRNLANTKFAKKRI